MLFLPVLLALRWPGSSRTFPVEHWLVRLEMIEAALFTVSCMQGSVLDQSSLSLTSKMSWNFLIAMVWSIIFLPMTSKCSELHGCHHRLCELQEWCASCRLQLSAPRWSLSGWALWPLSIDGNQKILLWKSVWPSLNRPTLSATSASCLIVSWSWSYMSTGQSWPAFIIYDGYGNSDVTWTSIP